MSLTGKQKRVLKGKGQKLSDDCHLGKAGLTASFIAFAGEIFGKKELIKLRFSDVEGVERKELAERVAAALGAECVSVLGHTLLLYKPNAKLKDEKGRVMLTDPGDVSDGPDEADDSEN